MTHRSCSILLLFLALIASANTLLAQTPAVEIQVFDYADLKAETLNELVTLTQEIMTGAGASVQVKLCRGSSAVPCEGQTTSPRRLAIRLVAGETRKMSNVRRPPLGQSFADHQGGTYASVFVERVQDAAAEANVPWVIVLAYASAHEVGHLLLGDEAHTAPGLMKATWDRKDFQSMNQNRIHFSDEQTKQLASRYRTASAPVRSSQATLEARH